MKWQHLTTGIALVAIHACQSGKDVYCQKPLAYTITEGLAVARAVRDNNRVFQIGSQQRSSKEFQDAIALVRAGKIGHIRKDIRPCWRTTQAIGLAGNGCPR